MKFFTGLRKKLTFSRMLRVALLINTDLAARRHTLAGVTDYVREHRPRWEVEWLTKVVREPQWTIGPDTAGVIAWPDTPAHERFLNRLRVPVAWIGHQRVARQPLVRIDNRKVGGMAAEYFLERGLRSFAVFRERFSMAFSVDRAEGFRRRLRESRQECVEFDAESITMSLTRWEVGVLDIGRWLAGLPKPVGVLADTDAGGYDLMMVCNRLRLRVPDEVAVISVGSDPTVCELASPQLSAVDIGGRRMGYEAARLLHRQFRDPSRRDDVFLDALAIHERGSSDIFAGKDAAITAARCFIRDHARERIGVDEVTRAAGISRRALEIRFKDATGMTVASEIRRVRLEEAQRLLATTDVPVAEVAERSGFAEPQRLSEAFVAQFGKSPREWRRERAGG